MVWGYTWNGGRINGLVAYIDLLGNYMTPSIYCQSSDSILVSNSLCSYFSDLRVCPLGEIDYVSISSLMST